MWFVFLVKGDGPRPKDQAKLEDMQKAHIDNFKRCFAANKLIGAGPLNDPTQFRRGIVLFYFPSKKDVIESFKPDPYVQSGIMNVEAHPWNAPRDSIRTELPDPDAIEENRLFLLTPLNSEVPSENLLKRQDNYILAVLKSGVLASGGRFEDGDGKTSVMLGKGTDSDQALKVLQKSPLVVEGFVKVESMPLWMARGVLG
jgi:uncharacterized protein YciI